METHYWAAWLETQLPAYNHVGWAFNVFSYGRGTENRTLIYWLKASYFNR